MEPRHRTPILLVLRTKLLSEPGLLGERDYQKPQGNNQAGDPGKQRPAQERERGEVSAESYILRVT